MQCSVNKRDNFYDVAIQWGTRKSKAFAFVEKRTRAYYVQYECTVPPCVHVQVHVQSVCVCTSRDSMSVLYLHVYIYMYNPCACARVGTVEVSMADCCTRHGSADHAITLEGWYNKPFLAGVGHACHTWGGVSNLLIKNQLNRNHISWLNRMKFWYLKFVCSKAVCNHLLEHLHMNGIVHTPFGACDS